MFGTFSDAARRRIFRYLAHPTRRGWNDIHGIIINWPSPETHTIWLAVIAIDPTFPRSAPAEGPLIKRWPRIPDAVLLARAIKTALTCRS
jgi:hypothetical protein